MPILYPSWPKDHYGTCMSVTSIVLALSFTLFCIFQFPKCFAVVNFYIGVNKSLGQGNELTIYWKEENLILISI